MPEKRKIIFRADGGPAIGMGHFIRTLALAEMLKDDFYCVYATQSPTTYQISEIEKVCHERIDLPIDNSHFTFFLNLLKGDEIVVLDNYYFTTEYQKAIKEKGCKLVCIDDLHDKEFYSDLIINHSPGIKSSDYKAQTSTKFALGLDYALLRPLFLEQTEQPREVSKNDTVMICFGAADPMNFTRKALKEIVKFKTFKKIIVVTGVAYQALNTLSELTNNDKRIEHRHALNQEQMIQTIQESDLAIVPTSGIIFELMAVGTGVITGYYTNNQKEASRKLSNLHLVFYLGNLQRDFKNKLSTQINKVTVEKIQFMINNQKQKLKNSKPTFINVFKNM